MTEQKTGQRLILNDGTIIEGGGCGYSEGGLWCWVNGYTMPEAAQIFLDPDKTRKIVFEYGETSDEYDGFTNCKSIFINFDGKISVCLEKGEK